MGRAIGRERRAYPFAILRTATGFTAGGLQFPSMATADTRERLMELLRAQVGLYLFECTLDGRAPEAPLDRDDLDLSDYAEEGAGPPEVVYVEPAPVSVASLAIERALREEGLSYADLARRMDTSRSVVSRITDPFYFGHTSRTLRSVAEALGREVHVSLERPDVARPIA